MTGFFVIILRELRIGLRHLSDISAVLAFFALVATLFAFGVGPLALGDLAGGVLWTAALLAAMLSLDRLFQPDHDDGGLVLLILSPVPLELVVLAKVIAHWVTAGVPILILAPLLGFALQLPEGSLSGLLTGMALGTPILSLLGALGAALVLGARRAGVLTALLILPLVIPVLIFGVAATDPANGAAPVLFLAAMLLGALALCPWATAAALRQSVL